MKTLKITTVITVLAVLSGPAFAQVSDADNLSVENIERNDTALDELWKDDLQGSEPIPFPIISEEEFEKLRETAPVEEDDAFVIEPFDTIVPLGAPFAANVNVSPYRSGGRLGVRFASGTGSCSAAFVGSTSVILTAAHCVQDMRTGQWARDFVFSRGHKNGAQDLYGWTCVGTKRGWTSGNNRYKYDYAFIKLNRSHNGYLGMRNGTPFRTFEAFGYPGNYGGTQVMHSVFGTLGGVANGVVEMNGNPMTQGSSGGPFVGAGKFAFSNVSHGVRNRPGRVYGPLFDRETLNLFNFVNNGCR